MSHVLNSDSFACVVDVYNGVGQKWTEMDVEAEGRRRMRKSFMDDPYES